MATVDGKTTAPDQYGIVQGDGGAVDKMSGGSGNDMLQGHAKFNQYYGGAGDDTFKLVAKFAQQEGTHIGQSKAYGDQFAYITDFQGAGVSGGDFIALDGFVTGSVKLEHTGATNSSGTLFYYSVMDTMGHTYNFIINSVNNTALGQDDFAYYGKNTLDNVVPV
ncbi:hypothetical protein [uncultured Sphingomonas sp.]|uniref:hypothetical protein n=1 Tax=uncultured Sphingomonas sp. TaxID=158754 RepID=UPI00374820ED